MHRNLTPEMVAVMCSKWFVGRKLEMRQRTGGGAGMVPAVAMTSFRQAQAAPQHRERALKTGEYQILLVVVVVVVVVVVGGAFGHVQLC